MQFVQVLGRTASGSRSGSAAPATRSPPAAAAAPPPQPQSAWVAASPASDCGHAGRRPRDRCRRVLRIDDARSGGQGDGGDHRRRGSWQAGYEPRASMSGTDTPSTCLGTPAYYTGESERVLRERRVVRGMGSTRGMWAKGSTPWTSFALILDTRPGRGRRRGVRGGEGGGEGRGGEERGGGGEEEGGGKGGRGERGSRGGEGGGRGGGGEGRGKGGGRGGGAGGGRGEGGGGGGDGKGEERGARRGGGGEGGEGEWSGWKDSRGRGEGREVRGGRDGGTGGV